MSAVAMVERPTFDPALRGYHAVYRDGEVNHCPGCGRTHWHIGRLTAECGFCGTALALADGLNTASTARPVVLRFGKGGGRVR